MSSPLPAIVQQIRDAASRASGLLLDQNGRQGDYFRVIVLDPAGQIRFSSCYLAASQLDSLEVTVSSVQALYSGWKCRLLLYHFCSRTLPVVISRPLPFVSKVRVQGQQSSSITLLIPGSGQRQVANLVIHYRARILSNPSKRAAFGSAKPLRLNPELSSISVPYYSVNNGVAQLIRTDNINVYTRSWSGSRTPGFGHIRSSQLPINAHSVYIRETMDGFYFSEYDHIYSPQWTSGFYGSYIANLGTSITGAAPSSCDHLADAESRAINRLVQGTGSEMNNLMQDLVQVGPTARTIADSASRIASSVIALKNGNIPKAIGSLWNGKSSVRLNPKFLPRVGRSLSSNWLALQYGWKPLLQDIDGSLRSLADYHQRAQFVTRHLSVSAKVKRNTSTELRLTSSKDSFPCGFRWETTESTCKYSMDYAIDNALLAFLSQTGFTNPLSLAWEILPFSFVVDWLLPIGSFLESLSAFQGLNLIRGCKTRFTRMQTTYACSYSGISYNGDPAYRQSVGGGASVTQVRLDRAQVSSWPTLPIPRFKNPASVTHALNGIALVVLQFRSR